MTDDRPTRPPQFPESLKSLWERTIPPDRSIDRILPEESLRRRDGGTSGSEASVGKSGWSIGDEIGRGGMGVVFRARQESLDRDIAIKKVRADVARSESARGRFIAEATVTGALDHPNIVPVHDLSIDADGSVVLAMKLVGGVPWKDLLHPNVNGERTQGPAADLDRHLDILIDVANAVAFAHSRGIVHGDLKPENVMIGEFGEVLVMDWGLAVDIRDEPSKKTWAPHRSTVREPFGTPAYMAPELAEGRGEAIGPHTDIYLLGAVLHEIVTGRPPHDPKSIWAAILSAAESRPPSFEASVPEELAAVAEKAMDRDPTRRYADVAAFQSALRDYRKHRESSSIERRAATALLRLSESAEAVAVRAGPTASTYGELAEIVAAFEQALFLWADNRPAKDGLLEARLLFARTAFAARDFSLAEAQIAKVDGPEARAFESEIRREHAVFRDAERSRRRLKTALAAAAIGLILVLSVGIALVLRERDRADLNAAAADRRREEVERLSDVRRLRDLDAEAQRLWPALPEKIAAMESWIERFDAVAARTEIHRKTLADLEARMSAAAKHEESVAEKGTDDGYAVRKKTLERAIEDEFELAKAGADPELCAERREYFRAALDRMAADGGTTTRPNALVGRVDDLWLADMLRELLSLSDRMTERDHGTRRGMLDRIEFARTVKKKTIVDRSNDWDAAAERIDDDRRFAGFSLPEIVGLVPLGPDPESGFEEFLHLFSHVGEIPKRDRDGRLEPGETTGIVLCLCPGGEGWLGAQADDPEAILYEPSATPIDAYIQHVRLDPFLISKFEISQAQWMRIMGENPSFHNPRYDLFASFKWSPLLPVETLSSYFDAVEFVRRLDLELPTEGQWEYAARGGTTWPWWTGPTIETLGRSENVLDATARRLASQVWPDFKYIDAVDDGALTTWSVYDGRQNPFGLKNVIGNVPEWCREPFTHLPQIPFVDGTGERAAPPSDVRVFRGGSHKSDIKRTKVSARSYHPAGSRIAVGIRPVRSLSR